MTTCAHPRVMILLVGLLAGACGARPDPAARPAQQVVVWRAVGSWAGRGNTQTESFSSDTGALRVRWETRHEAAPGAGVFRLTAHSAISGRPLEQIVEHRGTGSGVGYVNQDPHVFYVAVESDHLDWAFSVEEAITGHVTSPSSSR